MIALIDGDIIAYKASFYHQRRSDDPKNDSDLQKRTEDAAIALAYEWMEKTWTNEGEVFLTPGPSFRKTYYPLYKEHRKDFERPMYLREARQALVDTFSVHEYHGYEADDLLGMWQTQNPDTTVIVSIDKDLRQIPGKHFNPDKDEEIQIISEEEGNRNLIIQWLMGDRSDNIPGMKGIGLKKAERMYEDIMRKVTPNYPIEQVVIDEYDKNGQGRDEALLYFLCVYILRYNDYNPSKIIPKYLSEYPNWFTFPLFGQTSLPDVLTYDQLKTDKKLGETLLNVSSDTSEDSQSQSESTGPSKTPKQTPSAT